MDEPDKALEQTEPEELKEKVAGKRFPGHRWKLRNLAKNELLLVPGAMVILNSIPV